MNVMNRPKRFRQVGLAVLAVVVLTLRGASAAESQPRADFEIRDPFVLVDGGRFEAGRIVMKLPAGSQVYRVNLKW